MEWVTEASANRWVIVPINALLDPIELAAIRRDCGFILSPTYFSFIIYTL